jgi:hypothetical protein
MLREAKEESKGTTEPKEMQCRKLPPSHMDAGELTIVNQ